MSPGSLRLLQGLLSLLTLADLITGPLGFVLTLWLWLYLTLPYDTALQLWLLALVPVAIGGSQTTQQ